MPEGEQSARTLPHSSFKGGTVGGGGLLVRAGSQVQCFLGFYCFGEYLCFLQEKMTFHHLNMVKTPGPTVFLSCEKLEQPEEKGDGEVTINLTF